MRRIVWLLSSMICITTCMCAARPQQPEFSLRLHPEKITARIGQTITVNIEFENHSRDALWINTGVGKPATRGIPYESFFPRIRLHGETGFLPSSLKFVFIDTPPLPESRAISEGLIRVVKPKEIFGFSMKLEVSELLKDSIGVVRSGTYDLMVVCDPGHAPSESSFTERKLPATVLSNIVSLSIQ